MRFRPHQHKTHMHILLSEFQKEAPPEARLYTGSVSDSLFDM